MVLIIDYIMMRLGGRWEMVLIIDYMANSTSDHQHYYPLSWEIVLTTNGHSPPHAITLHIYKCA